MARAEAPNEENKKWVPDGAQSGLTLLPPPPTTVCTAPPEKESSTTSVSVLIEE
jgi:hypothetical protein